MAHYFGKICAKHPALNGERYSDRHCVGCGRIKAREKFKLSQRRKDKRRSATVQVFNHYGNVCGNCGISDPDVLTIDHVEQNGAEHRRKEGIGLSGRNFHEWLVTNNFPEGFRTLCFNCNMKAWRAHQRSLV